MGNTSKQRYWLIEHEDRDPDYPGWNREEDEKFYNSHEAIAEAKWLAETEGEFFLKFRVVEVNVVTTTEEVAVFET